MWSVRPSAASWATSTRARSAACCPACRLPSSTSAWTRPPSCTPPTSSPYRVRGDQGEGAVPGRQHRRTGAPGQDIMVQVVKDPLGTRGPASPPTSPCHPVIWSSCRAVPTWGVPAHRTEAERERLQAHRGRLCGRTGRLHHPHRRRGVGSRAGAGRRLLKRLWRKILERKQKYPLQDPLRGSQPGVSGWCVTSSGPSSTRSGRLRARASISPSASPRSTCLSSPTSWSTTPASRPSSISRRGERSSAPWSARWSLKLAATSSSTRPKLGDHGGHQHRGLVGHRNLEETILQHQRRGDRRHRPPPAPAQPRRYHHHRLHRHAVRGSPPRVLHSPGAGAGEGQGQDQRQRFLPARAGGDDPQAHPGEPGARALRRVPLSARARPGRTVESRSASRSCGRSSGSTAPTTRISSPSCGPGGGRLPAGEESHSLAELEVFIAQVRVVSEPPVGREQFDVVMM